MFIAVSIQAANASLGEEALKSVIVALPYYENRKHTRQSPYVY